MMMTTTTTTATTNYYANNVVCISTSNTIQYSNLALSTPACHFCAPFSSLAFSVAPSQRLLS